MMTVSERGREMGEEKKRGKKMEKGVFMLIDC